MKRNAFSLEVQQVDAAICSSNDPGMVIETAFTRKSAHRARRRAGGPHQALPAADVCKELWLPPGSPTVGNIGALVAPQGAALPRGRRPAVVRASGHPLPDLRRGQLRPALTRQIRHLGLEHRVILAGFRPDILSLLKGLDLFVMSSITEGLGTSILDAMAASKAVVRTTAGGIPEAVEDGVTGLLVPAHNADALAKAMLKLLKDEALRRRMGEAGLGRVRATFTVDRMVDETLAVYERVAGRPRAAGNGSPPPAS
jgi:hypothetical protein